jgi:arsenate reductase
LFEQGELLLNGTVWAISSGKNRDMSPSRPTVLFVCVHNAGRSQMAAGFLRYLGDGAVDVYSAGTAPADQINPVAIAAMEEVGIDIRQAVPELLHSETVRASDIVITMGCGDQCPVFPGIHYEDWALEDPAGKGIEQVRVIRNDIRRRVENLLTQIAKR